MRVKRTIRLFVGAAALPAVFATACRSAAADVPPTGGRVATVTRLVKLFLEKEDFARRRRPQCRRSGARSVADRRFRVAHRRAGSEPDSRADWMRELLRTRDPGGEISRMAVHDFGAVAIASFTQDAAGGPVFVVDVWRAQGADWKLAVRYASPAGSPAFAIPAGALASRRSRRSISATRLQTRRTASHWTRSSPASPWASLALRRLPRSSNERRTRVSRCWLSTSASLI